MRADQEAVIALMQENAQLRAVLEEIKHGYLVNHSSKWVKATVEAALSNCGSSPQPCV